MFSDIRSICAEGVTLIPLKRANPEGLVSVIGDTDLWSGMVTAINTRPELDQYLSSAAADWDKGARWAFAVCASDGGVVGSTALGNYSPKDARIEIGWTWVKPSFQRSGANRHAKFALLSYCFDHADILRVEFKTSARNVKAMRGLLGIGATYEGCLRSHTLMHDGSRRDTLYYSILRRDWDEVKARVFQGYTYSFECDQPRVA